jgi:hypothetical protein
MINGNLKYSENTILDIKKNMNFSKVTMSGFYSDLGKLKIALEKLYDDNIFHLGYGLCDAPFHGWSGEYLKNMREIDREICLRFKEIYAITLCGLGLEKEEK